MKRLLAPIAALLLAAACPAHAQVFGQLGGADVVPVDQRLFGLYAGFTSHQSEALTQLRLSFYPGVDFGFQGGLSRLDAGGHNRTTVHVGGDLKAMVARASATFPVDLALGAALGISSADQLNVLAVGPLAVASITRTLRGGAELVPYGGAVLLYTRSDINAITTTDSSLQLRLGLDVRPNAAFRALVEVQEPLSDPVDRHPKLVLGANFPF